MPDKDTVLKNLKIGDRVAEEEINDLEKYFVETDQWEQMYDGSIDIVYGAKGTGKSAIYGLLNKRENELFDRSIILATAENVRGATVFRTLVVDPPPSEPSFIILWKLYCLIIIGKTLRDYGISNTHANALINALETAKLLPKDATITVLFRAVQDYLKGWLRRDIASVEYGLSIDPQTGAPTATRKVEFKHSGEQDSLQDVPVEELLEIADKALESAKYKIWLLFDRLDVAFVESKATERNALRALFRAYNDMRSLDNVSLKIFVRDDIWDRISSGGFAEASHITKTSHIKWNQNGLLNLVTLRLINNPDLVSYLAVDPTKVKDDFNEQVKILKSILPDKIDTGKNPETFDWMISRTTDGIGSPAPRELIHLFECIRDLQIKRHERGEPQPEAKILFDRSVFKEALATVSKVRYEQTLVAEHPELKSYMDKLEGQKAEQTAETLASLWKTNIDDASIKADELVSIGFFEKRGERTTPAYWVPFLYRSVLNLIQGKAS